MDADMATERASRRGASGATSSALADVSESRHTRSFTMVEAIRQGRGGSNLAYHRIVKNHVFEVQREGSSVRRGVV